MVEAADIAWVAAGAGHSAVVADEASVEATEAISVHAASETEATTAGLGIEGSAADSVEVMGMVDVATPGLETVAMATAGMDTVDTAAVLGA
jgi:hypothetical protein